MFRLRDLGAPVTRKQRVGYTVAFHGNGVSRLSQTGVARLRSGRIELSICLQPEKNERGPAPVRYPRRLIRNCAFLSSARPVVQPISPMANMMDSRLSS